MWESGETHNPARILKGLAASLLRAPRIGYRAVRPVGDRAKGTRLNHTSFLPDSTQRRVSFRLKITCTSAVPQQVRGRHVSNKMTTREAGAKNGSPRLVARPFFIAVVCVLASISACVLIVSRADPEALRLASCRLGPDSPRVVLRPLLGGLGNQLFVIFAAVSYANRTRREPRFWEHQRIVEPARPTYWTTLLRAAPRSWLVPQLQTTCAERIKSGYEGTPLPALPDAPRVLLEGHCMHEALFSQDAEAIFGVLGLRERVVEGAAALAAWVPRGSPRPWVAVHIRRGDYESLGWVLEAGYYEAGARALLAAQPAIALGTLVLFSDEADDARLGEVRAALARAAPAARLVRVPSQEADHTEFAMMAACDAFLIPNSTFSWWAAFVAWVLGGRGHAVPVVMPDVEHDLIPGRSVAAWTRVHAVRGVQPPQPAAR